MRHSPLLPDSSNLAGPLGLWETVDEALDALNTAEHAAPDRAKGALAAIAAVLNLVQKYIQNAGKLSDLVRRCKHVAEIIHSANADNQNTVMQATIHLESSIMNIFERMKGQKMWKRIKRILHISIHRREMFELTQTLDRYIAECQLAQSIETSADVAVGLVSLLPLPIVVQNFRGARIKTGAGGAGDGEGFGSHVNGGDVGSGNQGPHHQSFENADIVTERGSVVRWGFRGGHCDDIGSNNA